MMRFSPLVAVLMVGATVACARGPSPQANAPRPVVGSAHGLVYASAGGGIEILDTASGQVAGYLPAGTPSPDWRWLYTVAQGRLQQIDTATGRTAATLAVPDWAQAVRTSANGSWLVLTSASTGSPSRFEVLDSGFAGKPVTVDLPGIFTFDGLSNDGARLYLLEWVRPGSYQVRMYDVAHGSLAYQVIADKREIGQLMSGEALTSLTSQDGASQLTLYQRSAKNQAFVHELPIGQRQFVPIAYCQDLPAPASGWGFVHGARGDNFFAVNPHAGWVVQLRPQFTSSGSFTGGDAREARISVTATSAPDGRQPAATVSPDGAALVLSTWPGLVIIDTGTLKVTGRFMVDQRIKGLSFAPDASVLYALSEAGSLLQIDPRTSARLGEITPGSPLEAILHTT